MKARVFRDPIHGLIGFHERDAAIARLLDTSVLQRLRRIRQLGFAWFVYPGAEHSRFGHALGAYFVAERVGDELALAPEVARDIKVAALLHDIGHGPFSHAWEVALGSASHEDWGRRIVVEDNELSAALAAISPDMPTRIEGFFAKSYAPRYARKLVSSQLDVDRMDYLLRDAHYSGVAYSTFDLDWLIHALDKGPVDAGADPEDLVIDYRRGINSLEQYLYGRFYMYAQVYHHKTVRAAENMFLAIMHRFAELARAGREDLGLTAAAKMARGDHVTCADYLALDDARVSCALDDWARDGVDQVLSDLSARLAKRRLFKTIELSNVASDETVAELGEAAQEMFGDLSSYYWALDRCERLGYDARPGEEIYVVGHPARGTLDLGQLIEEMPIGRPIATVRIVCAPELLDSFRGIVQTQR